MHNHSCIIILGIINPEISVKSQLEEAKMIFRSGSILLETGIESSSSKIESFLNKTRSLQPKRHKMARRQCRGHMLKILKLEHSILLTPNPHFSTKLWDFYIDLLKIESLTKPLTNQNQKHLRNQQI